MYNVKQRIILFLFVCLLVRSIPIYIIINTSDRNNLIILLYCAIGISFIYQYLYNQNETGLFGGNIWWNNLRLFHGLLYLLFVVLYWNKISKAYYLLIFDLLIGLLFFIRNYLF